MKASNIDDQFRNGFPQLIIITSKNDINIPSSLKRID